MKIAILIKEKSLKNIFCSDGIQGYQKLYNNFIVNDKSPEDAIKDTAKEVYVMVDNLSKSKLKAVKNKYSMEQFEKVGEII